MRRVALLALLALGACDVAPVPLEVPESWKDVRAGQGHQLHLNKGAECKTCHGVAGFETPEAKVCSSGGCHATVSDRTHALAVGDKKTPNCFECHDFKSAAPKWQATCGNTGCHPSEARIREGKTAHAEEDCSKCHTPHEGPPNPTCSKCHVGKQAYLHTELAGGGDRSCRSCHEGHAPKGSAFESCTSCHVKGHQKAEEKAPRIPVTALVRGHEACTRCHETHPAQPKLSLDAGFVDGAVTSTPTFTAITPPGPKACKGCHDDLPPPTGVAIEGHQKCTGCHDPHDARESAKAACVKCHDKVKPSHGEASQCTNCHAPHQAGQKAKKCAECHVSPPPDSPAPIVPAQPHVKGLGCPACHVPHEFSAQKHDLDTCARGCHRPIVEKLAEGHQRCKGCHKLAGHTPKKATQPTLAEAGTARCANCHEAKAKATNEGHQKCLGCHEPHGGAREKSCLGCHEKKSTGHGRLADLDASKAVKLGRGKGGEGCLACHSAHSDTPRPECASCHEKASRPLLHQSSGHQECAKCHSAHESKPKADRATCLPCHEDKRDHEPTAKDCRGCHPFKGK